MWHKSELQPVEPARQLSERTICLLAYIAAVAAFALVTAVLAFGHSITNM